MEGTELVHDPAIPHIDFLKMKFTVVRVESKNLISPCLFTWKSLNKIKKVFIMIFFDTIWDDLVDRQTKKIGGLVP